MTMERASLAKGEREVQSAGAPGWHESEDIPKGLSDELLEKEELCCNMATD